MVNTGWLDEQTWPNFPPEEGERRHKLIREQLGFRDLDCLIVCGHSGNFRGCHHDSRWVAGFASWIDENYIVFPFEGKPVHFSHAESNADLGREIGFIEDCRAWKSSHRHYRAEISLADQIKELGLERGRIGLCPMRYFPAEVYVKLLRLLPNAEFVDASDLIRQLRIFHSPIELEFIRKSGECADRGWEAMRDSARPGAREIEIAAACDHAMQIHGAESGPHLLLGSGNWKYKSAALYLQGGARVSPIVLSS